MARIVVGIDGSAEAGRALAFAIEEARLRRAQLDVVHAWHYPLVTSTGYAPPVEAEVYAELEKAAAQLVDEAVAEAEAAGIDARGSVVEGPPAEALVEAARDADLLVVGSRPGRLRGTAARLGQPAVRAPCPLSGRDRPARRRRLASRVAPRSRRA